MAGFLDKLKIKRTPKAPSSTPVASDKKPAASDKKPAASGKTSFWARKKTAAGPQNDDLADTSPRAAKTGWRRKAAKEKPAIDPKLPDASGPAPVMYELDTDSLLSGGRRKMAVGLLWQPRASGQQLHAQAKSASVGDSVFDLSVLYSDGAQVGFASRMDAHKDGMIAAATAIPRAFVGDTWLAAFVLPVASDKMQLAWWIVAHRDGLVYEDRLVRSEIEARESFIDLHDAPGWQTVICPSNWQIPGSQDIRLGYLIKSGAKGAALRSHSPIKKWAPRAIAAVLVLGGGLGAYMYWQGIQEQARLAEEARRQAEEMARLDALQVAPWEGMPGLQDGVIACATLINELQVNPPGWILQPITCTVTPGAVSAKANWNRQTGTMAKYLYSALEYRGLPPPQFDPTLQSASFSRSAGVPAHEWGKDLSPLNPEEMFSRLVHRFDTLALPLVLTAQTAPATPATSDTLDAPNRKIWNYHSIELESSVFPTELISLIGDIPAVVPQTLTYTPGTQTWKLSAFIYHPPIIQTS
jgi:hypothetical protein